MIQTLMKVRIRAVVVQRTMIESEIAAMPTIPADVQTVAIVLEKAKLVSALVVSPVTEEAHVKRHRY